MIKNRNEFRRGNLVHDALTGEWMTIDEVGENTTASIIDRSKFPLPDGWEMTPITLTDEILFKAFDMKVDHWTVGAVNGMELQKMPAPEVGYQQMEEDGHGLVPIGVPLVYVHDLQNRYFSLTGKEIPVNLKYGTEWIKKTD